MNYSGNDLKNMAFKSTPLGYSKEQIDEMVGKITEDYESFALEQLDLNEKIKTISNSLNQYKSMEKNLTDTLMLAQQTSEEVKKNAYMKADNIVKDAEIRARKILNDAAQEVLKITYKQDELVNRLKAFKTKTKTLIDAQLDLLEKIDEE